MTAATRNTLIATLALCSGFLLLATVAHAQTSSMDQLRATIKAEILSDPRSQNLTQAELYAMVNALATQAQKQGLTTSQLTYRPESTLTSSSVPTTCTDISCSIAQAFGLDGSFPLIPLSLFILTVLFILIYSIMREMGHPHAQG